MIGIYNSNKELYTYKVAHSFLLYCLSVQTREPKDEHCVLWCTHILVTPYP